MRAQLISLGLVAAAAAGGSLYWFDQVGEHRQLMIDALKADDARRVTKLFHTPYIDIDDTNLPLIGAVNTYVGYAVMYDARRSFPLLLNEGADVELTARGWPPLLAVVSWYSSSPTTALYWTDKLIAAGADPKRIATTYGYPSNIMLQASFRCGGPRAPVGWDLVIRDLRRRGISNDGDVAQLKRTPLHAAVQAIKGWQGGRNEGASACLDSIRALLDPSLPGGRPRVDVLDSYGKRAIDYTCGPGDEPTRYPGLTAVKREAKTLLLQAGSPPQPC